MKEEDLDRLLTMARDWIHIANREAMEVLGSPEGKAKLAESNRYRMLVGAIQELRAKSS